ncbi:DUF3108 domain-containing protein [Candidatus Thiodiazotropha sp. CDECU1]|uniref:DUF3108 domain-containing protein n=1 Tax=Candidatus Thiodiazotropha sp. CDECU1 TaxID=3065865 RepID=UPI00292EA878|nr:DUF3108 domain-containing protein [Candidatus Thiodiazotropha sp. CDECU1]
MIVRIQALFLVMGLMLAGSSVAAKAPVLGEHLEYTLKFRGVITGFVELDIAKMTMVVEQTMGRVDDHPAFVTSLQLTTEPYRKAEMLYPVRLHYRSWLDARKLNPLVAVKSLKTREHKEALLWFDHNQGEAYHYQPGELDSEQTGKPPQSLQQTTQLPDEQWEKLLQTHRIAFGDTEALDYISFLHRLRSMPLKSGEQIDFSTFNGKEINTYRVKVNQERLVRAGWNRPAFKVRLWELDPESGKGTDKAEFWLSDDEERLLLRFYAERTFGAMEGILETGRPLGSEDAGFSEATQSSLERYLGF